VELVSEGAGPVVGVERAGDEPLLLARRLRGVVVVVGADRLLAARWAVAQTGADLVLLDDGFQQRRLVKDIEVVCLDARSPWGHGGLFPRGTLREPTGALGRAHLVVLTHAGAGRNLPALISEVRGLTGGAPSLAADYEPDGLEDVRTGASHPTAALRGRAVLAFAGIAVPEGLVDTLTAAGAQVRDLVAFPDHHAYRDRDLAMLVGHAQAAGVDLLVTTQKDAVRLPRGDGPPWPPGAPPVWALGVRLRVGAGADAWRAALGARLAAWWRAGAAQ
jgi:tetraacyldisaccharide 4'-kinase